MIGTGIGLTLKLLTGGLAIGLVLGALLSILLYQGIASLIVRCFISIVRGTPLILQLSLVYFSLPNFTGLRPSIATAGIITFGLNSSAYVAEMIRGGIESLPKGQFEAAKTLQIPLFYTWKDIILPQVFRNIWPSIIGEIIALLKETALISTLGGMDLMRSSQSLAAEQFTYFMPLCIAGGYYYGLVLLIEWIGRSFEQRKTRC
jgi:polar amino acid transport system permease protein